MQLDVSISVEEDTVWWIQEDMGLLFGKNKSTIARHIASIFEEELDVLSCVAKNATQLKNMIQEQGKSDYLML